MSNKTFEDALSWLTRCGVDGGAAAAAGVIVAFTGMDAVSFKRREKSLWGVG